MEGKKISGKKIKRIVQYGRSTYYCPEIQFLSNKKNIASSLKVKDNLIKSENKFFMKNSDLGLDSCLATNVFAQRLRYE